MIKTAKSPLDPAQQKLKLSKKQWNNKVSTLIDDLINFKQMMNGKPSKFFKERSNIKNPIPADTISIISGMSSEFQSIVQEGNNIIAQQLEYSKTRKKKQPKSKTLLTPESSNLTEQLRGASPYYYLISEASNPLSRFWSHMKGPWFGDDMATRAKKYRMSMLKASVELYRNLRRLQAEVVGSTPESIFAASKMLNKVENELSFIGKSFATYMAAINSKKDETPDDTLQAAKEAIVDFQKSNLTLQNLDAQLKKNFVTIANKFYAATDKLLVAPELMLSYQAILADANAKYGSSASKLSDILMPKQAQMEVLAQKFFQKWLGKARHQLTPFDKTSALRLDIYKLINEVFDKLDSMMNNLEGGIDPSMAEDLKELEGKISLMREYMVPLETIIKNKLFDKEFIGLLKNKNLTEYDSGLNEQEITRLERMIQQRKLRDLTNVYRGIKS